MYPRKNTHSNQWSPRPQPANARRFLPRQGGQFHNVPIPAPNANSQHQDPGQHQNHQFVAPHQLYQHPPAEFANGNLEQPQASYDAGRFQDPINQAFTANLPIVHEGFIPAPGKEDEDDYPSLPLGYRDTFFHADSDDEYSADERELEAAEERLLQEIEEKNDNSEIDSDYSVPDAELEEGDPDEMLPEDAEFTDEEEERRAVRTSGRGTRGGQRGRPPGKSKGALRGSLSVKGRKRGVPGRPKGKRGPRAIADPGPEFRDLQRLANEAYVNEDYRLALEHASKAVQLNPEIFVAYSLLSEIYVAMGEEQKAIETLIMGAPTKRDKELWFHIIDRVKALDEKKYPQFMEKEKTAIVLECLRAIITLDADDYDARTQKLEIEASLGHISRCIRLCRKMLTIRPYDASVLKLMATMGTSSVKQKRLHIEKIVKSWDNSIAYFLANDEPATSDLDWSMLNLYLDLLDRAGEYDRALSRLKTVARWLQNRKEETYWDMQQDDREFDIEDVPRRITVPEFSRSNNRKRRYGETLPLEMRAKLGLFRLRQTPSNFAEAMFHFQMLDPDDDSPDALVFDYQDIFCDVADALHEFNHDRDALRFYEPVCRTKWNKMPLRSFIGMYTCYKNLGETEKAEEIIPVIENWRAVNVDDLAVVAKFFEDIGMDDEAMLRAEAAYRNGGGGQLRKIGFQGYENLREHFFSLRRKAQGKHSARKARARQTVRALKAATGEDGESDAEVEGSEPLSFGLAVERPRKGLFRSRKLRNRDGPKAFLPMEPEKLEGTDISVDTIAHKMFRKKLDSLTREFADELKSARAHQREIVASFERLDEIADIAEKGAEDAANEIVSITRELIEEFSTFDLFYSNRREDFRGYFRRLGGGEIWKDGALVALAVISNNVEDGQAEFEIKEKPTIVPQEFHGVHFDKWVDAFARYAIILAHRGDERACFSTLDVAIRSNIIFRSQKYHHDLEVCRLVCALVVDDSVQASSAVRWLLRTYPFSTEVLRLYSSMNRMCSIPNGFATGAAHKVLMRYIKTMDYVLLSKEDRDWYNFRGHDRASWMPQAVSSEIVDFVKDHDPALFALLGHVLASGGSYVAALNYYLRAFAITPDDASLNLSIGVTYIQHALKRLSENRQYQIQQGLAFINRYYEIRTKTKIAIYCSEAEYNVGRVWHSLGLISQALPAYERCIALSERVQEEAMSRSKIDGSHTEDFASEAAFAIQSIYILTGNAEAAREVTGNVLVIE